MRPLRRRPGLLLLPPVPPGPEFLRVRAMVIPPVPVVLLPEPRLAVRLVRLPGRHRKAIGLRSPASLWRAPQCRRVPIL